MGIPDHLGCLLKNLNEGQKQQLEQDMEQWIGSKLGKEYIKAIYCQTVYLTYMQSTSCEMLGQMTHKLESRQPGEILTTADDATVKAEEEEVKNLLMEKEEGEKKLAENSTFKKQRPWHLVPSLPGR